MPDRVRFQQPPTSYEHARERQVLLAFTRWLQAKSVYEIHTSLATHGFAPPAAVTRIEEYEQERAAGKQTGKYVPV